MRKQNASDSVLIGMSRVLAPRRASMSVYKATNRSKITNCINGFYQDAMNLESDWKRVGKQLFRSMEEYEKVRNN